MKISIQKTFDRRGTPVPRLDFGSAPQSALRTPHSNERGIALVITLILLSVITFMAVTFLVVTQSERKSVVTLTDQLTAKQAAESGLEFAKMAVLAPMVASNNLNTLGFFVSTNFIDPAGFVSKGFSDANNVNYDFKKNNSTYTVDDLLENISNLRYLPRAPVVVTNPVFGSNDFRFFVDYNRNRKFDPSGMLAVTNLNGLAFKDSDGTVITNFFWGDPQWIGVLERPGFLHSSSNFFVGRYAFVVVPSSTALDINNIYNYSKGITPNMADGADSFRRNMGVGSYELDLGAFLRDLNTNLWTDYEYVTNDGVANRGVAFDDALAFLRYRYFGTTNTLLPASSLFFGTPAAAPEFQWQNDFIDEYSAGPLMVGFRQTIDSDNVNRPWPGSDNTNRFFDTQDFFDPSKAAFGVQPLPSGRSNFVDRLIAAGSSPLSYDRYTSSRLFAQLGTDSAPDGGKLNINYLNVDTNGVVVPNMTTNFIPWTNASQFFTNVAIRLLEDAFGPTITNAISTNLVAFTNAGQYAITNYLAGLVSTNPQGVVSLKIQVYPTNFYTPSVQRLLQMAANIYDASTNRAYGLPNNQLGYPTVLRPLFYQAQGNYKSNSVFIIGYQELTNSDIVLGGKIPLFHDLTDSNPAEHVDTNDMVFGVPLIVGAKQGLPNFNELGLQTDIQVIRKLHFQKPGTNSAVSITNQIFTLYISNAFKVEAWNSYRTSLTRNSGNPLQVFARADVTLAMTNEFGLIQTPTSVMSNLYSFPAPPQFGPTPYAITNFSLWEGWDGKSLVHSSLKVPFDTNFVFLTTNVNFSFEQNKFVTDRYPDTPNRFPIPHWWLLRRVRLQAAIVDNGVSPPKIVDYVNLVSTEDPVNITGELMRDAHCENGGGLRSDSEVGYFFCTNRLGNPTDGPMNPDDPALLPYGVKHQLEASSSATAQNASTWWVQFGAGDIVSQTDTFFRRINNSPGGQDVLDFNAPFTPFRVLHYYLSWQANDPLVHYTPTDLTDLIGSRAGTNRIEIYDAAYKTTEPYKAVHSPLMNIGSRNEHFRPWVSQSDKKNHISYDSITDSALNLKDPMVRESRDWDFPTNKFPSIGWLGRVHRGSPWQTLYMKSLPVDRDNWVRWSGQTPITNWDTFGTVLVDDFRTFPTNDYRVFDLFTTALNDNSSRGKLSVNQTNLAAWSAVLSSVNVTPTATNSIFIQPAGIYSTNNKPGVVQILEGINSIRTNFPSGAFAHLGDVLYTPELTTNSPYLNKTDVDRLNDEVYERIPQQILGLLRGGDQPRFVVYAFGQTLRPAERSIMNNGPYFGMCTNYQVTAESTIRAVVRIDGSTDPAQVNNPDPARRYPPRAVVESYNVIGPYF